MNIIEWIGIVVLLIVIATFAWGGILAAPWVPMRKRDLQRLSKLISLSEKDCVFDLGSGDGRIVRYLAQTTPATVHGYEVAILPFLWSYITIQLTGLHNKAQVHYKNFYTVNFDNATCVALFLTPDAMQRVHEKVLSQLKPGCRVISYAFKIPGWNPDIVDKPSEHDITLYSYTKENTK